MKQLQAGYFIDCLNENEESQSSKLKLQGLKTNLSYFDIESTFEIAPICENSVLSVINNIITRGLPTRSPFFIEDMLANTLSRTYKTVSDEGYISYKINNDEFKHLLYRALHIIEPRYTLTELKTKPARRVRESLQATLIYQAVPEIIGDYFIQLMEPNKPFEMVFNFSNLCTADIENLKNKPNYSFLQNSVDFCITLPYQTNNLQGAIVEIDESLELENSDYSTEERKKELFGTIAYLEPILLKRANFDKINEEIAPLEIFANNEYFDMVRNNYQIPLFNNEDGLDALQLALTPLAIARIQKIIIEALIANALNLSDSSWKIAIIERDVPCGFLAIEDLKQLFKHFSEVFNNTLKLPVINLDIYYTPEFESSELNILYQGNKALLSDFNTETAYNLVIDISVLRRFVAKSENIICNTTHYVTARSAYSVVSSNQIYNSRLIKYDFKNLSTDLNNEDNYEDEDYTLEYFLKLLFRFQTFKPGQLLSLKSLLQLNNTLHISAPVSGKTIIFHFAAMLQPANSFIITPGEMLPVLQIKSLSDNGITSVSHFSANSNTTTLSFTANYKDKNKLKIINYISAKLLYNKKFRQQIALTSSQKHNYSYLIFDEAHTISEWNNDFKPYAAEANRIFEKLYNTFSGLGLITGAFTSVHSYDFVFDINTKLNITNNYISENLYTGDINYKIEPVVIDSLEPDFIKSQSIVAIRKQVAIKHVIDSFVAEKNLKQIVIFCPAKYGFDGVDEENTDAIPEKLRTQFPEITLSVYTGSGDDTHIQVLNSEIKASVIQYLQFISEKSTILVATKSAAYGLHPVNLNTVLHFTHPFSVNEFIQLNASLAQSIHRKQVYVLMQNSQISTYPESINQFAPENKFSALTFDQCRLLVNLSQQLSGKEKEQNILNELLTNIDTASFTYNKRLCKAVKNNFDYNIILEPQPAQNPYMLHFMQNSGRSLGTIDFNKNEIKLASGYFNKETAYEIGNFILELVYALNTNARNVLDNFDKLHESTNQSGIESIVSNLIPGNEIIFQIPFISGKFEKAANYIFSKLHIEIQSEDLIKYYDESTCYDDFELQLKKRHNLIISKSSDEIKQTILDYYKNFRTEKNTIKAVQVLFKLRIIDDYVIDTNREYVEITCANFDIDSSVLTFNNLISKFLTQERVVYYANKSIENTKHPIQKLLNTYIDYYYTEIIQSKIKDLQIINQMLWKGTDTSLTTTQYNNLINDFLTNYQFSKYLGKLIYTNLYNPETNFSTLIELITNVEHNKSDIIHLTKSVTKLLEQDNDNWVYLILAGYAKLIIENEITTQNENAFDLIAKGLTIYRNNVTNNTDEFTNKLNFIKDKILIQNYESSEWLDTVLELKLHTHWLQQFNKKYTKNLTLQ